MSDEKYDIKILRDGTWLYGGTPINRMGLVRLFAKVLRRDSNGDYWLITPSERGRIEVEDAPFIAVEMAVEGKGRDQQVVFRTNVDDRAVLDAAHPLIFKGENVPYILVRDGLLARLSRPVYYELVKLMQDGNGKDGIYSCGEFFMLEKT